jgi:hypothetical protein
MSLNDRHVYFTKNVMCNIDLIDVYFTFNMSKMILFHSLSHFLLTHQLEISLFDVSRVCFHPQIDYSHMIIKLNLSRMPTCVLSIIQQWWSKPVLDRILLSLVEWIDMKFIDAMWSSLIRVSYDDLQRATYLCTLYVHMHVVLRLFDLFRYLPAVTYCIDRTEKKNKLIECVLVECKTRLAFEEMAPYCSLLYIWFHICDVCRWFRLSFRSMASNGL